MGIVFRRVGRRTAKEELSDSSGNKGVSGQKRAWALSLSSDPDAAIQIMRQKMAVVPASSQFHGDLPLPWRWLGGVMCGFVLRPPPSLFSSQL